MGFIPGMQNWFRVLQPINVLTGLKNKNHTVTSVDVDETNRHLISIHEKGSQKIGIKGYFLHLIKHLRKTTVNRILDNEKLNAFPQCHGQDLTHIVLEVLTSAIKQEWEIKGHKDQKGEIKPSPFAD